MARFLSRAALPAWPFYSFLVFTQVVQGFYVALGASLPPTFVVLYPFALLWVVGWWLRDDARGRGVAWALDVGLFLYVAWPIVLPYYLFKTRGIKAALTIIAVVGVYFAALVLGAALGLMTI